MCAVCVQVAELKHIDIAKHMRGYDGGRLLMAAMGDVLACHSCDFILLQHDDRGSRKLIRFYEDLGFKRALSTLPPWDEQVEQLDSLLNEKHMLASLGEMRGALVASSER